MHKLVKIKRAGPRGFAAFALSSYPTDPVIALAATP